MKKKRLLKVFTVLAITTMALSGCGVNEKDTTETGVKKELNSLVGDGSSVADVPEVYETIEDISKFTKPTENQEYIPETDYPYTFFNMEAVEYGDSIYTTDMNGQLLQVFNQKTNVTEVLCNKPECSHNTADCVAYAQESTYGIFRYNDELYVLQQEMAHPYISLNLYKMDFEGTKKELVFNIATVLIQDSDGQRDEFNQIKPFVFELNCIQHRGYLYYVYSIGIGTEERTFYENDSNIITRVKLEGDHKKEYIALLDYGMEALYTELQGYGSYIYYGKITQEDDGSTKGEMYRFNTESLKNEKINVGEISGFGYSNGCCFYTKKSFDTRLYKYDIENDEETLFMDTEDKGLNVGGVTGDGKYLFIFAYKENENSSGLAYNAYKDICYLVYDFEGTYYGRINFKADNDCQAVVWHDESGNEIMGDQFSKSIEIGGTDRFYSVVYGHEELNKYYYIDKSEFKEGDNEYNYTLIE